MTPVSAEVPVSMPGAPAWQQQGRCCAREEVPLAPAHRGGRGTGVFIAGRSQEQLSQVPGLCPAL